MNADDGRTPIGPDCITVSITYDYRNGERTLTRPIIAYTHESQALLFIELGLVRSEHRDERRVYLSVDLSA